MQTFGHSVDAGVCLLCVVFIDLVPFMDEKPHMVNWLWGVLCADFVLSLDNLFFLGENDTCVSACAATECWKQSQICFAGHLT